jgi:hypothetical protein
MSKYDELRELGFTPTNVLLVVKDPLYGLVKEIKQKWVKYDQDKTTEKWITVETKKDR